MDGDDVISLIFASFVRIQKYFLMFIFSKHFTQDLSTTLRAPYGADRQPRLRYRKEPTEMTRVFTARNFVWGGHGVFGAVMGFFHRFSPIQFL